MTIKGLLAWKPLLLVAAAIALLAALGAGLAHRVVKDGEAQIVHDSQDGQDGQDGQQIVIAAKSAIETRMPDAQAISYGAVLVHWLGEIPSACGRVDIVEEEDSFEGVERFIYSAGVLMLEEVDGSDLLDQKWSDLCE